MKNKLLLLITVFSFSGVIYGQASNTFSLSLGSISTQNSAVQPATSLTALFEVILINVNEKTSITMSMDYSRYIAEGLRFSSCNDCSESDYSGWDLGVKLRFEIKPSTAASFNFFTGPSIVMTKEKYLDQSFYTLAKNNNMYKSSWRSSNYLNRFWDFGVGIKAPILNSYFLFGETLAGYSLDPSQGEPQGIGRYEFNLGVGVRF